MLTDIGLGHYLIVSGILFTLGLVVVMTRRNAIGVLMGLEMLLNAAGINFVAFNRFSAPERLDGQIFVIFIIILAAAEAATALALVLNIFHRISSIHVDEARAMKG
ncbi:MAG: NADH-quinone oxidoreductase subunit NuoK [Planctomycetes bacterium]|nr:NADH-quinone oxidoreductase subunit NuoK [Planctomycetota bacterium]